MMRKRSIVTTFIMICWGVLVYSTGTPFLLSPTGEHTVGTTSYHLVDYSRSEQWVSQKQPRELMMQVWYPADTNARGQKLKYMSGILPAFKEMIRDYTKVSITDLGYLDSLETHAILNAPINPVLKKYPLIIFSQGWGASRYSYTCLMEDLASHGYIVVAIDHPYESFATAFPDGKIIPYAFKENATDEEDDTMMKEQLKVRMFDMECALKNIACVNKCDPEGILTGAIDLDCKGAIGHSFGACVASLLSSCKAAINLDGWLLPQQSNQLDMQKPYMIVIAQETCDTFDQEVALLESGMRHILQHEHGLCMAFKTIEQELYNTLSHNAYYVLFKRALHSSFSDFNVVAPVQHNQNHIDALRGLYITRALLRDFMGKYLKGKPAVFIDSTSKEYPELVMQHKS